MKGIIDKCGVRRDATLCVAIFCIVNNHFNTTCTKVMRTYFRVFRNTDTLRDITTEFSVQY